MEQANDSMTLSWSWIMLTECKGRQPGRQAANWWTSKCISLL